MAEEGMVGYGIVTVGGDSILSLSTTELVPVLVRAVQELEGEVKEIKDFKDSKDFEGVKAKALVVEVEALKAENAALKKEVEEFKELKGLKEEFEVFKEWVRERLKE